eukprot:365930-Chlamydomonas_euryale.AAC.31
MRCALSSGAVMQPRPPAPHNTDTWAVRFLTASLCSSPLASVTFPVTFLVAFPVTFLVVLLPSACCACSKRASCFLALAAAATPEPSSQMRPILHRSLMSGTATWLTGGGGGNGGGGGGDGEGGFGDGEGGLGGGKGGLGDSGFGDGGGGDLGRDGGSACWEVLDVGAAEWVAVPLRRCPIACACRVAPAVVDAVAFAPTLETMGMQAMP